MDSINKRPNGRWQARDSDADRKQQAKDFQRKVDAQAGLWGVVRHLVGRRPRSVVLARRGVTCVPGTRLADCPSGGAARGGLAAGAQALADHACCRGRVHHRRLQLRPGSEHPDLSRRGNPEGDQEGSCHLQGRLSRVSAARQCTTAANGRIVLLSEHHELQREHRKRATDEGFQAIYRQHRPMVERSIAWLTRGNRRVPYRSIEKNNNWLPHRVAGLNLRRLLNMGLTNENGTWVLA
jgi:hypothetical protein